MEISVLGTADLSDSQSEDLTPFHHEPLSEWTKEFRLVEILPGDEDIIRCRVTSHSLLSPPEYYAASYEWGEADSFEWIELNGHVLEIRRNLWMFLWELRQLELPDTIQGYFIDAICIDQDHAGERNAQVQVMVEIYTNAKRVHAWLGPAADDSNSLIDTCVSDRIEELTRKIEAVENKQPYQDRCLPSVMHVEMLPSILALFSRTYWDRLWIVQEILLAQNIMVHCGNRTIPWSALEMLTWTFMELLSKSYHEQGSGLETSRLFYDQHYRCKTERFMHIANIRRKKRSSLPFAELLDIFGQAKCRETHDKIYGLMGLATEFKDGHSIIVNYSQPVEALFFDALKHCDSAQLLVFAKRLYGILHLDRQPHLLKLAAERYESKKWQMPAEINEPLQIEMIRLGTIRRGRWPSYRNDNSPFKTDKRYRKYDMKDTKREKALSNERTVSNPPMSLDAVEFFSSSSARKGDTVYWIHGTKFGMVYRKRPRATPRTATTAERRQTYRFLCGTTVSADEKRNDDNCDDEEKVKDLLESIDLCATIAARSDPFLLEEAPPSASITVQAVEFVRLVEGFTRPVALQWSLDDTMNNPALLCKVMTELVGMMWVLSDDHHAQQRASVVVGGDLSKPGSQAPAPTGVQSALINGGRSLRPV